MSRSDMMARLLRLARLAERCEQTGSDADEAIGHDALGSESRRNFAKSALATTAAATTLSLAPAVLARAPETPVLEPVVVRGDGRSVAVIGAGIAGLTCATELARHGVNARVFEASDRVGGRVSSLRDVFPGQVVERGAEFFSASHLVMLGYARQLGLKLERSDAFPGAAYYNFRGRAYSEAQVLEEYRAFARSAHKDFETLSAPSADRFSKSDEQLDLMNIDDYLALHQAGPLLRGMIANAYMAEYGAGTDQLSAISFLRFLYGDKRTRQTPFGTNGEDRIRVAGGNDLIAGGLADALPTPVELGYRLVSMRKLAGQAIRLHFDIGGGRTVHSDHAAVVMTLPFSVLRDVELHSSLQLPEWKLAAIRNATMGDHTKLLVGFKEPLWHARHGLSGTGYSDRPYLQATWEANPSGANAGRAVLAAQIGGQLARGMNDATLQADVGTFLGSLETVLPGAAMAVARGPGGMLAHSTNWSANPLSKGSLSYNRPGYFTTMAHNEAKATGNLLFAGDHTSSFYEWQGFMEGAAISGLRAAAEVLNIGRSAIPPKGRMPDAGARNPSQRVVSPRNAVQAR